jgi:hypothetical protein
MKSDLSTAMRHITSENSQPHDLAGFLLLGQLLSLSLSLSHPVPSRPIPLARQCLPPSAGPMCAVNWRARELRRELKLSPGFLRSRDAARYLRVVTEIIEFIKNKGGGSGKPYSSRACIINFHLPAFPRRAFFNLP